jgi:uncharacterized membrane protein
MEIFRLVFTLLGACMGGALGSEGNRFVEALLGGCLGFALGDLSVVRGRLRTLSDELARLRSSLAQRDAQALRRERVEEPPSETLAPVPQPDPARELTSPTDFARSTARALPESSAKQSPASAATTPHRAPAAPAALAQLAEAVRNFFTGGNTLVRVGVVILLFGVAFLLRYMAEHTHLPVELRLSGVAAGAIALLAFGWRLRASRQGYALAIQGGAVGILYLTVFAALRLYQVLPVSLAFLLLALIAAAAAVLAIVQDSLAFALLGVTGGFLAPVLASTGQGSHVVLFAYYAVLNAGILAVAWFKAWRPLNVAGFAFTFAIGTAWGVLRYRPEDFATTEPFLVLFFLFYVCISVLFTLRQTAKLKGYIDGTLVFGTPLIAFGLQSSMLHHRLLELAYSALAVSALYLGLAAWLKRRGLDTQRVLAEAFLALGVVFLTLAVPLALDVRWNAVTWALEGAALIWVGCRQARILPRVFGALLIVAAGFLVGAQFDQTAAAHLTLPLPGYYGALLLTAACLVAARFYSRSGVALADFEKWIPSALFCWGLLWWSVGGCMEITEHLAPYERAYLLAFVALTCLGSSELHRWITLGVVRAAAVLLLPAMVCFAAITAIDQSHPFAHGGWISWPFASFVWYWIMYRHEGTPQLAVPLNAVAAWFVCLMSSWEAAWAVGRWVAGSDTWPAIAWAAIPAIVLYALPKLVTRLAWPFRAHRDVYLFLVATGLVIYLSAWSLITNLSLPGNAAPLPYLPLINPLDIAQGLTLAVLLRHWLFLRGVRTSGPPRIEPSVPLPGLLGLTFIWLNAVLLRTLHQWFHIPYQLETLLESTLVETSLSIFWAILALATMLIAARKRHRMSWLIGFALLAVVVGKLFLVDLSRIGSVERIVSFLGVGLLMLVFGYFSPLPPSSEKAP